MYNLFKYKTNDMLRYGTWSAQTSQLSIAEKQVSVATSAYAFLPLLAINVPVHPPVQKEQSLKVQNNLDRKWLAWVWFWFFFGLGFVVGNGTRRNGQAAVPSVHPIRKRHLMIILSASSSPGSRGSRLWPALNYNDTSYLQAEHLRWMLWFKAFVLSII